MTLAELKTLVDELSSTFPAETPIVKYISCCYDEYTKSMEIKEKYIKEQYKDSWHYNEVSENNSEAERVLSIE